MRLCLSLLVLSLFLAFCASSCFSQAQPTPAATQPEVENLRQDLETFQKSFIEIKRRCIYEKSAQELLRSALKGMVQDLGDPYSSYMTNETATKMKSILNEQDSDLMGIGVQMGYEDGKLKVISPIQDSPAWRAGIRSGDIISQVDGAAVEGMDDASSRIKGVKGTPVKISVIREGVNEPIVFNLVREPINFKNVYREVLCPAIGYVRLAQFSTQSANEVLEALKYLDVSGCKAFILDLRHNPGGLLDASVAICNLFLPEGLLITFTMPRDASKKREWKAVGQSPYTTQPLVLLVDRGSASASEIVTGAMKDHKRAFVIGEKTFGKGSVQEIIDLPDGSALKLTIAKYHTPSGVCIHQKGIEPDLAVVADENTDASKDPSLTAKLKEINDRWKFQDNVYKALNRDPYLIEAVRKLGEQVP